MAFDGFFTAAVAKEIKALVGYRIERINCRGEVLEFTVYGDRVKKYLYISLSASANFVGIRSYATLPNDSPSTFCLLLRKHISAGKITEVGHIKNERIIKISFDSPDELGHIYEKSIYIEVMGKYSNLILTAENKVLGGMFTADLFSFKRAIMPGIEYTLPPAQDKVSIYDTSEEKFLHIAETQPEKECEKFLIDNFFCFSPLSAYETVYIAGIDENTKICFCDIKRLYKSAMKLANKAETGEYNPTAVFKNENEIFTEFWFDDIHRYKNGFEIKKYPSLCEMTGVIFEEKANANLLKERTSDLMSIVTGRIKRIEKKEALWQEELEKCATKNKCRYFGELITSNIYKMKQGDKKALCHDWETDTDVEIELDERLSPSQNAEKFFKKYRKLKSAEIAISEQLRESHAELDYLESVSDNINRSKTGEEAELIRDELMATGYIRTPRGKKLQRKPCKPILYITTDGLSVKVGRNNIMNDELTKSADKNDIWFHVKNFAGSHVILFTNGTEPTDRDYTEAAAIAAYHSSVRGADNTEVDYTRVKNVKKPQGTKPGFVTYDKYFTAIVPATGENLPESK